jgi:integrase
VVEGVRAAGAEAQLAKPKQAATNAQPAVIKTQRDTGLSVRAARDATALVARDGRRLHRSPLARSRSRSRLPARAALTGIRRGELLGLRWGNVDYPNGRVWVRRSIGIGGEVKKPKTARSLRHVAMPKTLRDELESWWKLSSHRARDDYVFAGSSGTPLDARRMIREVFEPARKAAKLPRLRFHDLLHSYASVLIAQGEHPKVISEQLGHSSVTITMDRYAHLFDRAWTDVSDSLECDRNCKRSCKHRAGRWCRSVT